MEKGRLLARMGSSPSTLANSNGTTLLPPIYSFFLQFFYSRKGKGIMVSNLPIRVLIAAARPSSDTDQSTSTRPLPESAPVTTHTVTTHTIEGNTIRMEYHVETNV